MQNDNIIEFQNVSYRYEADDGEEKLPLVVNNISLNFKRRFYRNSRPQWVR